MIASIFTFSYDKNKRPTSKYLIQLFILIFTSKCSSLPRYPCNHILKTLCVSASRQTIQFNFFDEKFVQKMDLGFEFRKTNVEIRIDILEILCVPVFSPNGQFWLFWPKFAQNEFRFGIQKTRVGIRISILEIPCFPIFLQKGQLWLFRSKLAQKWILGSEFQKSKYGFGISTSKVLCELIFSQNGQLWIFQPKFGEIAQSRAIFWF